MINKLVLRKRILVSTHDNSLFSPAPQKKSNNKSERKGNISEEKWKL